MAPIKWFKVDEAPYDAMWIDHTFWFPILLKQIPFKAHFKYLNDDTMLDSTIILLNSVEKTREIWVNIVIKKDHQILVCKNIEESKYLYKHEQVKKGDTIENAAIRLVQVMGKKCLKILGFKDFIVLDI